MRTIMVPLVILFSALPLRGEETAEEISSRDLGRRALEVTLSYTRDEDSDIRGMAAEVLGQAGNRSAAGLLKKMLADRDKHTRISAAEALWELGDPSGLKVIYAVIGGVPARAEESSPLAELKIISENKVREHAIAAFSRMKKDKASDTLVKLKNDPYGSIRDAAARELARLGRTEELSQFLDATEAGDEAIRFQGAVILGKICSPASAEKLAGLLSPENSMRVRMAALDAIKCSGGGKAALPRLLQLADDANPTLRFKAVSALSSARDARAFEKLKEISEGQSDISVKIAALKGLVAGGGTADPDLLSRACDSPSPEVKIEALKELYLLSDTDAKKCFTSALEDISPAVRLEAALQVLKRFGKPRGR